METGLFYHNWGELFLGSANTADQYNYHNYC
jgi:hypothetical protein